MPPRVSAPTRTAGDRCPGALRLHEAADGLLARVRLPGGLLTGEQVTDLADAAATLGDGRLHLTARGNVEIRGVTPGDEERLTRILDAAQLLPSPTHERVRNIVASPAAGLDGRGAAGDLVPRVRALDSVLVSDPRTAALSGRFLLGLDDGRGDVLALQPDIAARWITGSTAELILGGTPVLEIPDEQVERIVVAAALAFLDARASVGEQAWRIAELRSRAAVIARMVDAVAMAYPHAEPTTESIETSRPAEPEPLLPGPVGDRALALGLPLGTTSAETWMHLGAVARAADGLLRTTPYRSVVIGGLEPDRRADLVGRADDLGLIVSIEDPAFGVSACTGLPGCASSARDLRADLADVLARTAPQDARTALPVHVSGCDRRCGHPRRPHVEAVARADAFDAYATRLADGSPATGAPLSIEETDLGTVLSMRSTTPATS